MLLWACTIAMDFARRLRPGGIASWQLVAEWLGLAECCMGCHQHVLLQRVGTLCFGIS